MNDLVPSLRFPVPTFERDLTPERRPFSDLAIEVYGQRPVIGADLGINKGALDTYYPHGLLCFLLPYLEQEEDDFVELFCGNDEFPVAFTHVTASQALNGERIPLFIPHARLPDGVIQPVFFRLTRVNGGNQEETRRQSLMVDTIPPAGPYDPIPSTPWHEGMAPPLPPPFIIDYGVDRDSAERGVPITVAPYPLSESDPHSWRMAEHDRIRLFIGGVLVEPVHRVTWDEANNRLPLTMTIYYETWLKVGDGQKVLEYEAIDQCGNYSVKWSPQTVLKVNIGNDTRPRLAYAYIDESHLGDEFDTLDYDELGEDNDATIVVTQVRQGYERGDALRIIFEGRTADNAAVREVIDYPIPDEEIGRNTRLPLRNAIVRELVGGTAVLSYERIRSGEEPQPSEVTRLAIVGSLISRLERPLVLEAIGDFLDPTLVEATVQITPYTGQNLTDRVDLFLLGTKANDELEFWHFFKMAGSDKDPVIFYLRHGPDLDIAGLNGGTLQLHYLVGNAEGVRESRHTLLQVGEASATLPVPNVPEAIGGILDPEAATRGATVVVPKTANLELDDRLNVYWRGSKPGGSFTYRQFDVTSQWLNTDIPFPIDRQYVDANRGGSVKASYLVERDRNTVFYSHVLSLRIGQTLDLRPPEVLEASAPGDLLNPINAQNVATIRVRYEDMRNSDNIKVYWDGAPGDTGSPAIAPKPGNSAQGYVDFAVTGRTVAANIGRFVTLRYEVTRDEITLPSQSRQLRVLSFAEIPGGNPLPSLQIEEAQNSRIDVNGSVTFRVNEWPFFRQGERVWLTLESGSSTLRIWTGHQVTATEFQQKYLRHVITGTPASADWLKSLADGSPLRVVFKVAFGGGASEDDAQSFPSLNLNVLNQPAPVELPPPSVLEATAPGNLLNPMNARQQATVRVRYDMRDTDSIKVYWEGVAGSSGSPSIAPKPGNASLGHVDFTVPGLAVGTNIGRTVNVRYEVTRDGVTRPSDSSLSLRVLSFAEIPGGNPLPALQIEEARNGIIDVNGSVTFRVNEWPFFREGDYVWLILESGSSTLRIWDGSRINATEFQQKYLRRVITGTQAHAAWLRALPDGSSLNVVFKVVLGGGNQEANAQVFNPLRLNVLNQTDPIFALEEKFDGMANQFITRGETLDISRSMAIQLLESTDRNRTCGVYTYDYPVPDFLEGPALVVNYNLPQASKNDQRVKLTFKATYRKVSFTCSQRNQALTVRFLGTGDTLLDSPSSMYWTQPASHRSRPPLAGISTTVTPSSPRPSPSPVPPPPTNASRSLTRVTTRPWPPSPPTAMASGTRWR